MKQEQLECSAHTKYEENVKKKKNDKSFTQGCDTDWVKVLQLLHHLLWNSTAFSHEPPSAWLPAPSASKIDGVTIPDSTFWSLKK